MKYALIEGELEHISNVNKGEIGICPVCKTELVAKKGEVLQYFAHIINTDLNCEAKFSEKHYRKQQEATQLEVEVNEEDDLFTNSLNNKQMQSGFTDEQIAIINSPHSRIMVNARAGSGKTSTIEEYVKRNPQLKMLYLVFNKSMSDEAKERFGDISNVDIKTIHSYAFKDFGVLYRSNLSASINVFDVAKALGIFAKEFNEFAYLEDLKNHFETYLLSEYHSVEDYVLSEDLDDKHLRDLKKLFQQSKNHKMKVTHSFYYKLWHLSNPQFDGYDVLLVDEVQDVNSALVDVIKSNTSLSKIIIIGDSNQALYKFAKCVNAFELLDKEVWTEYSLTYSFRIGDTLAQALNKAFTSNVFDDSFNIVGMNNLQKIVYELDYTQPYFELCRFNATIISGVIQNAIEGKKVYIEGGKAGVSFSYIKSIYEFKFHNKKGTLFQSYEDYNHLMAHAVHVNDYELLFAKKLIDTYKESLLLNIRNAEDNLVEDWKDADVCFSTLHKSKGKTITIPMRINADCLSLIELAKNEVEYDNFITEANLLYVGCTRCKNDIELPNAFFEIYNNTRKLLK